MFQKQITGILLLLSLSLLFIHSCQKDVKEELPSFKRLADEQFFSFDPQRDTILFGENGVRLFIPAGSFKSKHHSDVEGLVDLKLVSAVDMVDLLLMDNQDEKTLAVVRVEVSQNGEELKIKQKSKVLIQFPKQYGIEGVSLEQGRVRRNGVIKWNRSNRSASFLIPVDFSHLAFHPKAFSTTLSAYLPFGGFKKNSIALSDSLYFSFGGGNIPQLVEGIVNTALNEPYYNTKHIFRGDKYTDESFEDQAEYAVDFSSWPLTNDSCSINPAAVKALKSSDLSTTFLATPAFEKRLALILSIGIPDVLHIYIENIDADLWSLDQRAADFLENIHHPASPQFKSFAMEGLTNTEGGAQYAELLRNTMNDRISAIEKEIEIQQEKIAQALNLQNEQATALRAEYQKLLWEREKHRMDAYTFDLTELGWMWLNREQKDVLATDTVAWRSLNVKIAKATQFDELYVYSVLPSVHSIYKLSSIDQEHFYVGNKEEKQMLQLIGKTAKVIAVGYKNDHLFLGEMTYNTNDNPSFTIQLARSSKNKLERWLSERQVDFSSTNQIYTDLEYSRSLQQEVQRQRELWEQQMILLELAAMAYPGCNEPDLLAAAANFRKFCTNCHDSTLKNDLTGPALAGVTKRHQKVWFIRWVNNSQRLIAEGDPAARAIWKEWGPTVMIPFAEVLSTKEISDIYDFLAQQQ